MVTGLGETTDWDRVVVVTNNAALRWMLALFAGVVLGTAAASPSAMAGQTATYSTPGCENAPEWRLLYRFYARDTDGVAVADGSEAVYRRDAQKMVADVGTKSDCGLRMVMTMVTEDAPYTAAVMSEPVNDAYDSEYVSAPGRPDSERDHAYTGPYRAMYPVSTSEVANGVDLLHEWMHQAVDFWFGPLSPLGLPIDAVHGRCSAETTQSCPGEND